MSLDDLEVSECAYCEVPYGSQECLECPLYEDEYPNCFGQHDVDSELCKKCIFQNECKDWSEEESEVVDNTGIKNFEFNLKSDGK